MAENRALHLLLNNKQVFNKYFTDASILGDDQKQSGMKRAMCRLRKDLVAYVQGLHAERLDPAIRSRLFNMMVKNDGLVDFYLIDMSCSAFIANHDADPRFWFKGQAIRYDNTILCNNCIAAIPGSPDKFVMCFRFMLFKLPFYEDGNQRMIGVCHGWDRWFNNNKSNNWMKLLSGKDSDLLVVDTTGVCSITMERGKMLQVTDVQFDVFPPDGERQDARIFMDGPTSARMLYNTWGRRADGDYGKCVVPGGFKKDGQPTRMCSARLTLQANGKWVASQIDTDVCEIGSNFIEKNWQILPFHGQEVWAWGFDHDHFIAYDGSSCRKNDCDGLIAVKTPAPFIHSLTEFYDNTVHVSLSTPPVSFGDELLLMGHAKVEYRKLMQKPDFFDKYSVMASFFDAAVSHLPATLKTPLILHDKFIYFMFFFTLDKKTLTLRRMSSSFIPTTENLKRNESHLPWLLVFPTGLAMAADYVYVTYGEGDMKMKMGMFAIDVVDKHMLKNVDSLTPESYEFRFYTASEKWWPAAT